MKREYFPGKTGNETKKFSQKVLAQADIVVYIYHIVKVHPGEIPAMKTFGEFIKDKRLEHKITLREFCRKMRIDPSNWSKIERGKLPPPKSKTVLAEVAQLLDIRQDSEDWQTLFDLAVIAQLPIELIDDQSIVDKLPVFFRTLRGEKPSRQELEDLILLLRKE